MNTLCKVHCLRSNSNIFSLAILGYWSPKSMNNAVVRNENAWEMSSAHWWTTTRHNVNERPIWVVKLPNLRHRLTSFAEQVCQSKRTGRCLNNSKRLNNKYVTWNRFVRNFLGTKFKSVALIWLKARNCYWRYGDGDGDHFHTFLIEDLCPKVPKKLDEKWRELNQKNIKGNNQETFPEK